MIRKDVAVIGGSLGGVLAAWAAAKSGCFVVLFEETDWIGGQLTSQAVPPDEHRWIEQTGCTASYRAYRNRVRDAYRANPDVIEELRAKQAFCPAGSSVSRISHPPRLAFKLLYEMLAPYLESGKLEVHCRCRLASVQVNGDRILSVRISGAVNEEVYAAYFLDGTDTGELIAQSGCEFTVGAESALQTGERHAPAHADSGDLQPSTWAAAVEDRLKGDYTIDRPAEYAFFRKLKMPCDDYPVLSMYGPDSSTGKAKRFGFYNGERDESGHALFGLFAYRRIVRAAHFTRGVPYDVTVLNWPQNDYFLGNLLGSKDAAEHAYMARQLTLSLLYWLQTEAERFDGGKGYRSLALNTYELGTQDGLAMAPYIRESRRICSLFTIREQDVTEGGDPDFYDSVGVGSYPIDLHITTVSHRFFYQPSLRFTIPLGAFLPIRMRNLLPSCKNIGTTQLTNGCYRLHPVEWNIGEVSGLLAAYSLKEKISPREIRADSRALKTFQDFLRENGIQLRWDDGCLA